MSRAARYSVYGLVVESELPLSSVDRTTEAHADAAFRIAVAPAPYFQARIAGISAASDDWVHHAVLPDGSVYMKVENVFETIVSPEGRDVTCRRFGGSDASAFEANLLNFVVSTVLTLRGEEPLHATVVQRKGKGIALLGPSGAGKSTLAACLVGQGAELVTDDMLRLGFVDGGAFAYPGPYRLKLFDEPARRYLPGAIARGVFNASSGKTMMMPGEAGRPARPAYSVAALFWLGDPDAIPVPENVSIRRLGGAELAKCLISSAMDIRYRMPDRLVRQFRFSEQVARTVPVYALTYPRTFTAMDHVVEEIDRAVLP